MSKNFQKIYVENLRSLINTTTETAKGILDIAVKENILKIGVEFVCPIGGSVYATEKENAHLIPKTFECEHLEMDNHYHTHLHGYGTLSQHEFYYVPEK